MNWLRCRAVLRVPWRQLSSVASIAVITLGATYGIHRYRYRFIHSNADLIACLPKASGGRFFADVALLRSAGVLHVFSAGKLGEDPEYRRFGRETHFDYRRDLDALGGSVDGDRAAFLLWGRFDRRSLWRFAAARGGACDADSCRMPASTPGRWIRFALLQPDILGLSVGPSPSEPLPRLDTVESGSISSPPPDPVWVELPERLLQGRGELPLPLQIVAISLQSAAPVFLSVGAAGDDQAGAFLLKLDARFPNPAAADTIRKQLEFETKSLSLALARRDHGSDPKDFTGLLASGTFQVSGRHMLGRWLIRPELLHSLE